MEYFDSHAHYDDEKLNEDRDEILKNIYDFGVTKYVNIGCDIKTSKDSIDLANNHDFIYASVGIHPSEIREDCYEKDIEEIKELAIFIMLLKNKKESKKICELYLNNLDKINNWDLIDYSAPHIIAPNLSDDELRKLANSDYLWANRVAMVSCIYFIKQHNFNLTFYLCQLYLA